MGQLTPGSQLDAGGADTDGADAEDQARGNEPCCHPMEDEDTGPGEGAEAMAGAAQDEAMVWAP